MQNPHLFFATPVWAAQINNYKEKKILLCVKNECINIQKIRRLTFVAYFVKK